jgi:hypothetical protein
MHFCHAEVRLAGDLRNLVVRDAFSPVSWPEIEVLRALHGHDAVENVKVVGEYKQSAKEEKERLRLIYGNNVLEDIFPGKNPQMELEMPGVKSVEAQPWFNPIMQEPAGWDAPPEERKAKVEAPKARTAF